MTDTVTCQNCGTDLPSGAAFCTNCGTKVDGGAVGESGASTVHVPASAEDATRIETPGLHDATRVFPAAPSTQAPESQDPTRVSAPATWTPPPVPPQPSWEPPAAAPQREAWEPPPPPPPQPQWARQTPPADQPWSAPPVPIAPPSQWQQPAPSSYGPDGATATSERSTVGLAAVVAFVGAIVLVIGVFTLWLQSAKGTSVKLTGWEMVTKGDDAKPFDSPDPAILLGIAAAAIAAGGLLVAGKAKALMRTLLALAGVGAAVVLVRDYLSIKDAVKNAFDSGTTIDFQYGFWLAAAGAVILIVAAVVPSRKHNESPR